MTTTVTCVSVQGGRETRRLDELLDARALDAAAERTYRWIKQLRLVSYDGVAMRERFRYRDASLWWFTELYLHKTRRMEAAVRLLGALEAATERYSPAALEIESTSAAEHAAAVAFGCRRGLPVVVRSRSARARKRPWSGMSIGVSATLSRLRPAAGRPRVARPTVAAFVHTAFWQPGPPGGNGGEEQYIGPVLDAVTTRLGASALTCVGVGPRRNFRARRWWDPVLHHGESVKAVMPIERLAPRRALSGALGVWRHRHTLARDLVTGSGIRGAAEMDGYDLWDVLEPELMAAARLQWPWSARALDEAGAALDALTPQVVVTYAEAGGWGRAIVLEARRRGVPSVGVQHGFIYRHWLNYRHEPDELRPVGGDEGFPHPDRTLLFDGYARRYLAETGRLPVQTLAVTGSAKLDALAARVGEIRRTARTTVRRELGVEGDGRLLVLAAKFTEIHELLPELFEAVGSTPGTRLVVKTHPAETTEPYRRLAQGAPAIDVAPPDADLARLLAAGDAVVTRNSTVAIDALVLGLPAVVLGLSSNLSPFVDAGVMAGAERGRVRAVLDTVLYDRVARQALLERAASFAAREQMQADGHAAGRAADAIVSLAAMSAGTPADGQDSGPAT